MLFTKENSKDTILRLTLNYWLSRIGSEGPYKVFLGDTISKQRLKGKMMPSDLILEEKQTLL